MHNHSDYQIDLRKTREPVQVERVFESEAPLRSSKSPLVFKVLAYALLFVTLFTPLARAYADEGTPPVEIEAPIEPTIDALVVPNEGGVLEEVIPIEEITETTPDEEVIESVEETTEETVPEDTETSEENNETEEVSEIILEEGEVLGEATTTSEAILEEAETLPEEVIEEVEPEVVYIDRPYTPDASKLLFNSADCVTVNDNEFYCVKAQETSSPAVRTVSTPTRMALVQKDGDGDLEIYLSDEGVTKQITSNVVDDDAPSYDSETGFIVWHAPVKDRYQIFVYDPKTNAILQLTETDFNNTNPSIDGGIVSWQAWEDDNWEIFYMSISEGISVERVPEIVRVSRNTEADMFPKSYGGFIAWQARVADSWRTRGFNTDTKEYMDLGEGTGGDVSSARLVLLVERRTLSGEIERFGYEMETGEAIPLGTQSQSPSESAIPESPIDGSAGSIPETNIGNALKTASRGGDGDTDADTDADPEAVSE